MKKIKILVVSLVLLSLAACIDAAPRSSTSRVTTSGIPQYQEIINNWTGKQVSSIIKYWGAPTKTFTIAGKEYIVYIDESTVTDPGVPGSRYRSGTSGYSYDVTDCTWTFEIRRGTIVGGNAVDARAGGCSRHAK